MIAAAAACALLALLIWAGAFHVGFVHDADGALLIAVMPPDDSVPETIAETVLLLIHPYLYAPMFGAVVAATFAGRGFAVALRSAVAIGGANVTTQLLKPALAEPRFYEPLRNQVDAASWPSGHATAAAAVALALLLLIDDRRIAGAVVGAAVVIAAAVVVAGWHYPSDALGGLAVAGAWFFAAQAVWPLPGSHSGSSPPLAPRDRMKSRSESRLR